MCTVSWLHEEDGYQLLANRDEQRRRPPAEGPQLQERASVRHLAPLDGKAGGTWLAVNEFGISICLLNGACLSQSPAPSPATAGARERRSRGLVPLELVRAGSALEACERAWRLDLAAVSPFTLVILEPGQPAALFEWTGEEKAVLLHADPYMPLISSSFDEAAVNARRRQEFSRKLESAGKLDAHALYWFHESHGASPDAYSPCMHRADAETVSFSWVRACEQEVGYFYTPAAPCRWRPGETIKLARRQ
ncbi:MAG: NRDE family protein [Acidobacteria bacterium]|nr:NRDE family protein [Acidobacteriota bacterium]